MKKIQNPHKEFKVDFDYLQKYESDFVYDIKAYLLDLKMKLNRYAEQTKLKKKSRVLELSKAISKIEKEIKSYDDSRKNI